MRFAPVRRLLVMVAWLSLILPVAARAQVTPPEPGPGVEASRSGGERPAAPPDITPDEVFAPAPRLPAPDSRAEAGRRLEEGLKQIREGNDSDAEFALTEAIALDPNLARAYSLRGFVRARTGRSREAVKDLDQSVKLAPDDSKMVKRRDHVLEFLALPEDQQKAEIAASLRASREAAALIRSPAEAQAALTRSPVQDSAERLAEYERAFRPIGEVPAPLVPGGGYSYTGPSELFRPAEDPAKKGADPATSLGTPSERAYDRAVGLLQQGDLPGAEAAARESLRLDPTRGAAVAVRGVALAYQGRWDEALADAETALGRDSGDVLARFTRALVRRRQGDHAGALADVDVALQKGTDSAHPFILRALILAQAPDDRLRDGRRALESARRACEIEPGLRDALVARAAAHAELGEFRAAVVDAVAAARRPGPPGSWMEDGFRILSYLAGRSLRETCKEAGQGVPLNYGANLAWSSRGVSYRTVFASIRPGTTLRVYLLPGLGLPVAFLETR